MEILFEILFELYLSIATILVPEHKFTKRQQVFLQVICVAISVIILACIIAGIYLIDTAVTTCGIIVLSVGCVLLAVQVALIITVIVHQVKKEKRKKKNRKKPAPKDEKIE